MFLLEIDRIFFGLLLKLMKMNLWFGWLGFWGKDFEWIFVRIVIIYNDVCGIKYDYKYCWGLVDYWYRIMWFGFVWRRYISWRGYSNCNMVLFVGFSYVVMVVIGWY